MSFNLVESVKEVFSPDMTNKIAGMLGESSVNVKQALQGIVPSVLTGFLLKAESGDAQGILNLATEASRIEIPFNLNSLAWWWHKNSKGIDYVKSIFGEKTSMLSDAIAEYSEVSNQSASSLMSLAAPAALGVLGKYILEKKMNASGLNSLLKSQQKKILNSMPASLLMEGILGVESLSGLSERFSAAEMSVSKKNYGSKWVFPVILCLIAIGVAWYFWGMQKNPGTQSQTLTDTILPVKDTTASGLTPVNPHTIKLPNGALFIAKKGGIEEQFVNFLNDPDGRPSRRFLFNFDQVNFNGNTAILTNESMEQIQNIATILKAYPRAKIKIGAFNERDSDSSMGRKLSESRAAAVAAAIKAAGANARQVTGSESFGSEFAKYPEDAADSLKVKDRHISISVREK